MGDQEPVRVNISALEMEERERRKSVTSQEEDSRVIIDMDDDLEDPFDDDFWEKVP